MDKYVSAIITTKNSEKTLDACLRSIENQSYKKIETIIVDNFSTDKTIEIAKKYTKNIYIFGDERSIQRNLGAKKAKGDILLFIDSDMELTENVVSESFLKIKLGFGGVYIPEITKGNSLWSKIRTYERSFYDETPIDAIRCIDKKIFEKIGGFDENLTGPEDWDLTKRLLQIAKTTSIKAPLYHHEQIHSAFSLAKKKLYYAQGLEKYKKKWGENDIYVKKQFDPSYRLCKVFFEDKKWIKIIYYPHFFIILIINKLIFAIIFKCLLIIDSFVKKKAFKI